MATLLRLVCLLAFFTAVLSDCYMHNPRGSNNRLNERSANRANANRLFDSQNNNRGGYNAGDIKENSGFNSESEIYYMKYFQSGALADSYLTIEWTNQHGCGGNQRNDPHKLNCNIVLQYMAIDYNDEDALESNELVRIRNGQQTNTQNFQNPQANENQGTYESRRSNSVQQTRGLHESFDFYNDCYIRERNRGLFVADQSLRSNNLGVSSAIYTRQNPNGNRRGYECPEERDYYPYWHPTPWRDMAVLTDNTDRCDYYREESFNRQRKYRCRETYAGTSDYRPFSEWNNQEDCETNAGEWVAQWGYLEVEAVGRTTCENTNNTDGFTRVWAVADPLSQTMGDTPQCLVLPPPPDCAQVGWTRVNHLGNGRDGVPLNYTWKLPFFPSDNSKLAVVRIRYNISTDDYDPWNTNSSMNQDLPSGVRSPVTQNPNVDIGSSTNKPLRLAINTAQFGRTFQDRTHIMELRPRTELPSAARTCQMYNLNVRGKRGNIVQVYPSVEYDFVPNRMEITNTDCVHIQWTGSNTHNNGNPAGDGQAGDAGEGTGGTDRSNIVETVGPNENYPLPWEKSSMFKDADVMWSSFGVNNPPAEDLAIAFSSAGYYTCRANTVCGAESVETKTPLNRLLNNASPSFEGAVVRFPVSARKSYSYICSRNNNFTNRSQKGMLTVTVPAATK